MKSVGDSQFEQKPLEVKFDSLVNVKLHDARLTAGGLLQCDPVVRLDLITVRRSVLSDVPNKVNVSFSSKFLGESKRKIFTSTPIFDETLSFSIADTSCLATVTIQSQELKVQDSVQDSIIITIEDSTSHRFLGQAFCPFSPHSPSMAPPSSPIRLMLQPRNVFDPADPLFLEDKASLKSLRLDDFGSICISWNVTVVPVGGVADTPTALTEGALATIPSMPIGITVKATWLVLEAIGMDRSMSYSTSVEFGDAKRFRLPDGKPLFLTLHNAEHLHSAIFYCSAHNVMHPDKSRDIPVVLPLPPLTSPKGLDRDVHWTAAVRSAWGEDFGALIATIRLSKRPLEGCTPQCPSNAACLKINDPLHQEEFSHVAMDYKRAPPRTPFGAYQPILWESEDHVRQSIERQRKREVVLGASPTEEHVRHLFDVLMGRTSPDEGVAKVASEFFHCPSNELMAAQLKELMVAFAFNSKSLSVLEAARFLFIAFRSDVEDAVAVEEVHYMVRHSLLEKTLDMPEQELRRWVTDLMGRDAKVVKYCDFTSFVLRNFAFWYLLGTPLKVDRASSSEPLPHFTRLRSETPSVGLLLPASRHQDPQNPSSSAPLDPNSPPAASKNVQFQLDNSGEGKSTWRTFVIRVTGDAQKAFSVTVHFNDKVRDGMKMVEESTGIKAECQQWRLNNETVLEPGTVIGSTVLGVESLLKGSARPAEVWISEMEEAVPINFLYKERNKRWQQRIPVKEKVLLIRASVQRQTLIPLSRCVLRLVRHGKAIPLQDRHPLSHYSPAPHDVIEVTQE